MTSTDESTDPWAGIPPGEYTIRAFGKDRRLVVERTTTVTGRLDVDDPSGRLHLLQPAHASQAAELVRAQLAEGTELSTGQG